MRQISVCPGLASLGMPKGISSLQASSGKLGFWSHARAKVAKPLMVMIDNAAMIFFMWVP